MTNPEVRILSRRGTFFAILTMAMTATLAADAFNLLFSRAHPFTRLLPLDSGVRQAAQSIPAPSVHIRAERMADSAPERRAGKLWPKTQAGIMDPLKQDSYLFVKNSWISQAARSIQKAMAWL